MSSLESLYDAGLPAAGAASTESHPRPSRQFGQSACRKHSSITHSETGYGTKMCTLKPAAGCSTGYMHREYKVECHRVSQWLDPPRLSNAVVSPTMASRFRVCMESWSGDPSMHSRCMPQELPRSRTPLHNRTGVTPGYQRPSMRETDTMFSDSKSIGHRAMNTNPASHRWRGCSRKTRTPRSVKGRIRYSKIAETLVWSTNAIVNMQDGEPEIPTCRCPPGHCMRVRYTFSERPCSHPQGQHHRLPLACECLRTTFTRRVSAVMVACNINSSHPSSEGCSKQEGRRSIGRDAQIVAAAGGTYHESAYLTSSIKTCLSPVSTCDIPDQKHQNPQGQTTNLPEKNRISICSLKPAHTILSPLYIP